MLIIQIAYMKKKTKTDLLFPQKMIKKWAKIHFKITNSYLKSKGDKGLKDDLQGL